MIFPVVEIAKLDPGNRGGGGGTLEAAGNDFTGSSIAFGDLTDGGGEKEVEADVDGGIYSLWVDGMIFPEEENVKVDPGNREGGAGALAGAGDDFVD